MNDNTNVPAPPLGLIPRFIVDEHRLAEIDRAILRYAIAYMDIPQEWRDERDEIVTRLNAFYNRSKGEKQNDQAGNV